MQIKIFILSAFLVFSCGRSKNSQMAAGEVNSYLNCKLSIEPGPIPGYSGSFRVGFVGEGISADVFDLTYMRYFVFYHRGNVGSLKVYTAIVDQKEIRDMDKLKNIDYAKSVALSFVEKAYPDTESTFTLENAYDGVNSKVDCNIGHSS